MCYASQIGDWPQGALECQHCCNMARLEAIRYYWRTTRGLSTHEDYEELISSSLARGDTAKAIWATFAAIERSSEARDAIADYMYYLRPSRAQRLFNQVRSVAECAAAAALTP